MIDDIVFICLSTYTGYAYAPITIVKVKTMSIISNGSIGG